MNMTVSFADRVRITNGVLLQEIQGETMFLHLAKERYHGLDQMGSHLLRVLTSADCIQSAFHTLLDEYDVDEVSLRADLQEFVAELLDKGLIETCDG